jgi:hypothetical protein
MQELKDAIRKIIKSIKRGYYFDSHTVILMLLQKHHDTYLLGSKRHKTTDLYHSAISRMVKGNKDLVEDSKGESFSKNVHDNFNECHLWKRI